MKKYIILFVIILFTKSLYSQDINTYTPEVFSFAKEVFSPLSHYTGQANISIPIYTIQTNNISIPISMNYIGGNGLQTLIPYSSVGYGWRLTAGGCISRQVNFFPDEKPQTYDNKPEGFFYMPANTITNVDVRNKANTFLVDKDIATNTFPGYKQKYEYAPDIFTFNFLGYSGYFLMGYDKKIYVQSEDIFDVQICHHALGYQNNYPNMVGFHIIMTDKTGTKYTFGASIGSIEVSQAPDYNASPPQINAWYLSKIEFQNGSTINFKYDGDIGLTNVYTRKKIIYSTKSTGQLMGNYPVVLDEIVFNEG